MSFSAVNEGAGKPHAQADGDWRRPRKYSRSSVVGRMSLTRILKIGCLALPGTCWRSEHCAVEFPCTDGHTENSSRFALRLYDRTKPSPFTPLTTLKIAELIADKVPAGVLNIITGEDSLGPLITAHKDIDKVTFTGSTATGKKIMEGASKDLKRITLELGGNDASIVLPDADVKKVAEQLFWASFSNAGQICVAAKRIYIHEDIYDELSAAITAYAKEEGDGSEQELASVLSRTKAI